MSQRSIGPSGEWMEREGSCVTIGYTEQALEPLGDIVWVGLPKVGETISQGDVAVVFESAKAATDCESPLSGTIVDVNRDLEKSPNVLQEHPDHVWVYRIESQ